MIKFSKRVDYGLLLISSLADAGGRFVPLGKIAKGKKIPLKFLSNIAVELAAAGWLKSREGRGGGYRLLKNPQRTKLSKLISLLEGPLALVSCETGRVCTSQEFCNIKNPLRSLELRIEKMLDSYALADVI